MEFEEEMPPVKQQKPQQLSEANLDKLSENGVKKSNQPSLKSSKGGKKGKGKPAWATTEKQQEDAKDAEIDDLIEFAYDLDYEQYMEDYEVRQALAIIKDRVNEIKQDDDWKMKMADEWNNAQDEQSEVGSQAQSQSRPR